MDLLFIKTEKFLFINLSERVDELKNEESEVLAMCQLVEDYAVEQKILSFKKKDFLSEL